MNSDSNENRRKRFTPEEKFKIVKEHLQTKTSISDLCRKYGITSASFYGWQEQFFAGAISGFEKKRGPQPNQNKNNQQIEELESDIHRMREVIAEISAENIAFKKKNLPYLK